MSVEIRLSRVPKGMEPPIAAIRVHLVDRDGNVIDISGDVDDYSLDIQNDVIEITQQFDMWRSWEHTGKRFFTLRFEDTKTRVVETASLL